jgi:hypothetical protein
MSRTCCRTFGWLLVCSALTAQAVDPSTLPDDRRIHWQRTLADAEALAKATGRPLLLALNMDGESASDRVWHENYRDPRFVALTRRVVCVAASVFRHNPVDYDADGRRIECPRLCGVTCGEHMAAEPELFARHFPDGERVAPRHALILADGTRAFDLSLAFDLCDVDKALAAATADLEPWATPAAPALTALAQRRDAEGRRQFEASCGAIADARDFAEVLTAASEHGDAGALPALRRLAARLPDAPLQELLATAERLQLGPQLRAVLREQAQRLAFPGELALPPSTLAVAASLDAHDADLRTRSWSLALQATTNASGRLLRWSMADNGGAPAPQLVAFDLSTLPAGLQAPVSIQALLAAADAAARGTEALPRAGVPRRALASADELHRRLAALDRSLAERRDDAELLAEIGIASLDLARVQLETGGSNTQLLLQDAATYLERATRIDGRFPWWLERARAAFYLQQFDQQVACGTQALARRGHAWPPSPAQWPELLQDAEAVEAINWIGDGEARQLANDTLQDPVASVGRMRSALLGLGLAAASPYGDENDQIGFASFAESLGLVREEAAILLSAQRRLPQAAAVRQSIYGALWRSGMTDLAPALADQVTHGRAPADAAWWSGHARLWLAEDLRRRERPRAAAAVYAAALPWFTAAAATNADYAGSVAQQSAIAFLGHGQALCQGPAPDRAAAAGQLRAAIAVGTDLSTLRDGLGYDVLDLVDKILEWRADGPSPVDAITLLDSLPTNAFAAFWATAISDSALREALRADGRNPERSEAETVDAAGKPIRMPMGLPTELGDRYLAAAIVAGERAFAAAAADELARTACAQALTIHAERQLRRGRSDGVAASLARARHVLGMWSATAAIDDTAAYAADVAELRQRLGPARPRQRDGR